ncbi:MAG: DUF1841 family protein [Gammaproteobacteria bacterium]|nr:DUF1841 family protein [Gammaproteobacteria bacterium]
MYGSDRTQMRRVYTEAWRKRLAGEPMDPLEQIIASVVEQHPEYHGLMEAPVKSLERDFLPDGGESNPFLHLAMHLSLQEQISTNRPAGVSGLYRQLTLKCGDAHTAEHKIMECLAQMIWEAQRQNRMPDEQAYLDCIKSLV